MKNFFTLMLFTVAGSISVNAQTNTFPLTGAAGIGTTTPNIYSLLEILSVKKGVLIPRMTKTQRDAIATSASGLLIYQTNSTPGFYYYSNTALWTPISPQPGWSLTGNAGTTASNYLGTSNKKNLVFRTNNIQRAVIDNLGNMGIGTTIPAGKLEVHNGSVTISSSTTANLIINAKASGTGNSNQILFADNGITKWALGGSNIGGAGTNDVSLYNYNTDFNAVTILNSNNNVGIGTTTPGNKLHVFNGSAGVAGNDDAPLIVENSRHCYINILAPDGYTTGVLFGKTSSNVSGGIFYGSSGTPNGFQFRTNGNITRMVLTDAGSLGVGTTDPGPYPLKLSGSRGLNIEDASTNGDWELESVAALYDPPDFYVPLLDLYWNDAFRGAFDFYGNYSSVSDERLKTNIKPMSSMLEKINQLEPSTYQFKNKTDKQEYNGFIAQDVQKIFPDLVMHTVNSERNLEVYTLNYNGFGVIAIKGIQELLAVIAEQNEKITVLEKRVSKLEDALARIKASKE